MSMERYYRIMQGVESIFLKSVLDKSTKNGFTLFQTYNVEIIMWRGIYITWTLGWWLIEKISWMDP